MSLMDGTSPSVFKTRHEVASPGLVIGDYRLEHVLGLKLIISYDKCNALRQSCHCPNCSGSAGIACSKLKWSSYYSRRIWFFL